MDILPAYLIYPLSIMFFQMSGNQQRFFLFLNPVNAVTQIIIDQYLFCLVFLRYLRDWSIIRFMHI
jgi:hypothetical protein